MGYQRPKTPRFFVDMMSYLHATGHGEYFVRRDEDHSVNPIDNQIYHGEISDLLYCNTSSNIKFQLNGTTTLFNYKDYNGKKFPKLPIDCLVMLNHNLQGTTVTGGGHTTVPQFTFGQSNSLINWNSPIEYNGFSIKLLPTTEYITPETQRLFCYFYQNSNNKGQRYIGNYFFGKTYTPTQDPKVTMTREFDGISVSKTKGGFSYHNINYLGNPLWNGHNAWELWKYPLGLSASPNENPDSTQQPMFTEDKKTNLGRLGRRKWTISFTHLAEYDLYAALEQTNWNSFEGTDLYPESTEDFTTKSYDNPILEEDNFMSRLWIPTLGGSIPFLFQPDDEVNSADQFAICTFDKHSISITPKAPNVYTITFNINEVW